MACLLRQPLRRTAQVCVNVKKGKKTVRECKTELKKVCHPKPSPKPHHRPTPLVCKLEKQRKCFTVKKGKKTVRYCKTLLVRVCHPKPSPRPKPHKKPHHKG